MSSSRAADHMAHPITGDRETVPGIAARPAIVPPIFEVGPKAYAYGQQLMDLARRADILSDRYRVQVIITPQYVDIAAIAQATKHVHVYAQHVDPLQPGRGVGAVLPEAIRAAGAHGVLLNHAERRLSPRVLRDTIRRSKDVGLATMICADNAAAAVSIAALAPDIVVIEEPALISAGRRDRAGYAAIRASNEAIWRVDPTIRILHAAGIKDAGDVYSVVAAGAQGTGSSSAIFAAPDPTQMLEQMLRAVRDAWDHTGTGE